MKDSLTPGITFEYQFKVTDNKTVPYLYPEIPEGAVMPKVFATGFLVGLFEFACISAVNPHLDWPAEQTVGISVNINHKAATPPGFTITVTGKLEQVNGRKLSFSLSAHDGIDEIADGTHDRFVILKDKFNTSVQAKQAKLQA